MKKAFDVPILFLTYNRIDCASEVFNQIKIIKPKKLYFASNSAKENNPTDFKKIESVRSLIKEIDWDCNLHKRFLNQHLEVQDSISSSISWFFSNEKMGIILEDDCLPDLSFFDFCKSALDKYKDKKNVWMINGFNPNERDNFKSGCFLSRNPSVWGWATWKDRWENYSLNISSINKKELRTRLNELFPRYVVNYYLKAYNDVESKRLRTWDYQAAFMIFMNNGYVVKPYRNLIKNIGIIGVHSNFQDENHCVETFTYKKTNMECKPDLDSDNWFFEKKIKFRLQKKIKYFIKRLSYEIFG